MATSKKTAKARKKKSSSLGPRTSPAARHWRVERDGDDVLWLHFDQQDSGANTLSAETLGELERLLESIKAQPPAALVMVSDKPNGFVAGADINEFTAVTDTESACGLIRRGQAMMDELAALEIPTVAAVHGFCLGGGLELALACRYRVADDGPATQLGLPEVRLGIHPGFGGTVRLTRLIGPIKAMDMMLNGRPVSARAAKRLGLVDHAVPRRHLRRAARALALDPPPAHRPGPIVRLLNHRWLRPALGWYLRRRVGARASPKHYPAPYALINLWVRHGDNPQKMLAEEAYSVAKLMTGYTARNLVRVFFLQERLKSLGKGGGPRVERVHVIGGGVMGGDIAAWCALQGLAVTVQDTDHARLAKVVKRAHDLFRKKLREPRLVQAALDRLLPDMAGLGLRRADLVVEAIFEDADAKQKLFRQIEPKLKPGALIATNTSSIPLETLGRALRDPKRLVGLHFFNPVAKMQLVEVVHGQDTDEAAVARAAAFTKRIKRLPLPVRSAPGFLVNRILMPYLMEAVVLYEEGVTPRVIDKAATDFGMPMGPIALADAVGLDICLSVARNLAGELGGEVPARLEQLVEAGRLGRKSGHGFYPYTGLRWQRLIPRKPPKPSPELADRLLLRLLNEAVTCLREQIVAEGDLLDAGIVFGTGFAPFHGGPLRYIRHTGPANLREQLEQLADRYGDRFRPDPGWRELEGN